MKKILFLIAMISLSCEKTETPDPVNNNPSTGTGSGTTSTTTTQKDASLPESFQLNGCFLQDFSFDLNSSVANEKQGYKYSYDKLNRLLSVSAVNNATIKTLSTYSYSAGKVSITFDKPLVSVYSAKGTAELTLDSKNRVIESNSKITSLISGQPVGEVMNLKISYKYDANGYLIEDINENGNTVETTKYTWKDGNLIKAETTRTVNNVPANRKAVVDYTYDLSKVTGTWDGGTLGNSAAYFFTQAGYVGKSNKNMISKIVSSTQEFSTVGIVFDYTLTTTTDYKYTFDSKNYPTVLEGATKATVSGNLPAGISIPETNVTFKANLTYTCI